jgi:hypothetical protein
MLSMSSYKLFDILLKIKYLTRKIFLFTFKVPMNYEIISIIFTNIEIFIDIHKSAYKIYYTDLRSESIFKCYDLLLFKSLYR